MTILMTTKKPVYIVGAGFLGGLLATELIRILAANKLTIPLWMVDYETVDGARNPYNQIFTPADDGKMKANTVVNALKPFGVPVEACCAKVDEDNLYDILEGARVVVDCVDNLKTRKLLHTLSPETPVVHIGIANGGTGAVEWENYSLANAKEVEGEEVKHPPCTLVGYRPLGLWVASLGAIAVASFLGCDPRGIHTEIGAKPTFYVSESTIWEGEK